MKFRYTNDVGWYSTHVDGKLTECECDYFTYCFDVTEYVKRNVARDVGLYKAEIERINAWLDERVPGEWGWSLTLYGMNDPDTAFEFKMRFQ